MKIIKRILIGLFILIALANVWILATGNTYIYKALYYQYVGIDDFSIFSNRVVASGNPIVIPNKSPQSILSSSFRNFLIEKETTAFLVLQNDSIIFEEYWDGYGPDSMSGSFSVAKTIVSIMVGIAIDEGKINNIDQKVSDFLPDFAEGLNSELTIRHLLTMSAGFEWDEAYSSLFSPTTEAYYGNDLRKMVSDLKVVTQPGTLHAYQSCNQLVLACVLEKATGKTLSEYTSEKLWKPIGASSNALWSLDSKDGLEKAYCCFNSNARDFSRIGSLFLHNGKLYDKQIVSENYVKSSIQPCLIPDESGEECNYYGYSWWISSIDSINFFYARGILGQYIIVVPSEKVVIVRLGRQRPDFGEIEAANFIVKNVLADLLRSI